MAGNSVPHSDISGLGRADGSSVLAYLCTCFIFSTSLINKWERNGGHKLQMGAFVCFVLFGCDQRTFPLMKDRLH